MKIHQLKRLSEEAGGEYVLGLKDLDTHACYMIYGTLAPGEKQRLIKAGKGHEEIIVAARGELRISGPGLAPLKETVIAEGSAFHITEESEYYLENTTETEALYIAAGGHSTKGH
jgi:hypothetical protein